MTPAPGSPYDFDGQGYVRSSVFFGVEELLMPLLTRCSQVLLITTMCAAPAAAQTGAAAQPPAQSVQSAPVTLTATIEAIDQTNRLVTLKGPKGNLADVYVGPEYKRFNELKVGDTVKATYYESLVTSVRKPGDPAPTAGVQTTETPRAGAPGQTIAKQVTIPVTIMALDPSVPSVTVKGPKGNVLSFRVQDPKRLEGIKVGDTVDVTYTQAILLSVDPSK
jgi:Cu/Ag efflux protein CusF